MGVAVLRPPVELLTEYTTVLWMTKLLKNITTASKTQNQDTSMKVKVVSDKIFGTFVGTQWCFHCPCGCVIINIPRDIQLFPLIVMLAAGRKWLSDQHYANQCGGRLCALHALQLLDMEQSAVGVRTLASLLWVITVQEIGREMFLTYLKWVMDGAYSSEVN